MAETVDQLKQEIVDRYAELSNEEKTVIESMAGTQELRVLGNVLGPELSGIANMAAVKPVAKPRKRGLGTR